MLRKLLLASPLVLVLGLSGCATVGGGTVSVASVQQAAVAVCGFLPTAASVAAIISAATGGTASALIQTADQIASTICASVASAKSGKLRGVPTAYGVPVHGKFVR